MGNKIIEKVSVLIPVFNRQEFILKALMSIQNQTYKNIEIIIYDDGSTDNTCKLIKQKIEKDNRIVLIEGEENKGVGYARNRLIEFCQTKYAIWMDSDDISDPRRIKLQLNAMKTPSLVFCKWLWLRWSSVHKNWLPSKDKSPASKGFATLLFIVNKNIKFNENKKLGGEDWDWIKKMRKIYKIETVVGDTLYFIRYHNDRIGSWKRKLKDIKGTEKEKNMSYKQMIEEYKEKNHEG